MSPAPVAAHLAARCLHRVQKIQQPLSTAPIAGDPTGHRSQTTVVASISYCQREKKQNPMLRVYLQPLKISKAFAENRAGMPWHVSTTSIEASRSLRSINPLEAAAFQLHNPRKDRRQDSGVAPGLRAVHQNLLSSSQP